MRLLKILNNVIEEYKELKENISHNILEKSIKLKSSELLNGIYNSIFAMSGLEFDSVTENDLKNAKYLHWPSTIKKEKEVYKKFKEERALNLILVIDEKLLKNKYYLIKFLFLKKEINKILDDNNTIKKLYLIRTGNFLSFNNLKLLNKKNIENWLKNVETYLLKKEYQLDKLLKIKKSLIIFYSDFRDFDIIKIKKILNKKNNELIPIIYRQNYDFYYLFEPFEIYPYNKKSLEISKKLKKHFNKVYIL